MFNKIIAAILTCGMMMSFKDEMSVLVSRNNKTNPDGYTRPDYEVVLTTFLAVYKTICITLKEGEY